MSGAPAWAKAAATLGAAVALAVVIRRLQQRRARNADTTTKTRIGRATGLQPQPRTTLPAHFSGGAAEEAQSGLPELPVVCAQLLLPATARLMVPLVPPQLLEQPDFKLGVTGASGIPLLTITSVNSVASATSVTGGDGRDIAVTMHNVDNRLVTLTSEMELLAQGGKQVGRIVRASARQDQEGPAAVPAYELQDRAGRALLTISSSSSGSSSTTTTNASPDSNSTSNLKMTSLSAEGEIEKATAVLRPPVPDAPEPRCAEHYEMIVNKYVDAVLILACLLAVLRLEQRAKTAGSP